MARNRKRAKERRARRPQTVSVAARGAERPPRLGPPSPLEHAAPDIELAEAAELPAALRDGAGTGELELGDGELDREPSELEHEAEAELEPAGEGGGRGRVRVGAWFDDGEGPPGGGLPAPVPEARALAGNRLLTFLQGSWRELQRVQWPDRRQVMQATGVVIGFVIVAGVFLGVSDYLAGKVVGFILNGHF